MSAELQHICGEVECCYIGKPSPAGCGCHKTREQIAGAIITSLEEENARLRESLVRTVEFFAEFPELDLTDSAADGGVTVGMVWQQFYRENLLPSLRATLQARGEGR